MAACSANFSPASRTRAAGSVAAITTSICASVAGVHGVRRRVPRARRAGAGRGRGRARRTPTAAPTTSSSARVPIRTRSTAPSTTPSCSATMPGDRERPAAGGRTEAHQPIARRERAVAAADGQRDAVEDVGDDVGRAAARTGATRCWAAGGGRGRARASCWTSSGSTWSRPSIAARALAARSSWIAARGEAPSRRPVVLAGGGHQVDDVPLDRRGRRTAGASSR